MSHLYLLVWSYSLHSKVEHISSYRKKPTVSKFCFTLLKFVSKLQPQQDHCPATSGRDGQYKKEKLIHAGGGRRSGGHRLQAQQTIDVSPSSWEQKEKLWWGDSAESLEQIKAEDRTQEGKGCVCVCVRGQNRTKKDGFRCDYMIIAPSLFKLLLLQWRNSRGVK